jgi:dTDP-4-dehydrorhamnose 3,5-epimerase
MRFEARSTHIEDILIIQPRVLEDTRGFFMESWRDNEFRTITGCGDRFVQDNHSRSRLGVLRGLHYQLPNPQGKLVRVAVGRVFTVAVDLRTASETFAGWVGVELSGANRCQMWIPGGFAHGFLTLSETADVLYKMTAYYAPDSEHSIRWDDPQLGVDWPLDGMEPVISERDLSALPLVDAMVFE